MSFGFLAMCLCLVGCDWIFKLEHIGSDASHETDVVQPDAPPGPGSWAQVTVGDGFTCAISQSQLLYCWGYNGEGQLGLGRSDAELLTPNVLGSATWLQVAAGVDHACGIQTGGTLYCWGQNSRGQLGNDDTNDQRAGVPVFGGYTWLEVATHDHFTCGVRTDHTLWCWGANSSGELGDGSTTDRHRPTEVGSANWAHVATGLQHACALTLDQHLLCWGANAAGQYGNASTASQTLPLAIGTDTWLAITAGDSFTCGIKASDGRAYCWGADLDGALGDGATLTQTERDAFTPQAVASNATDWTTLVAGEQTVCGLRATGTMACWGDAAPVAISMSSATPLEPHAPNPPHVWTSVAVGRTHSCAITDDHNLYCVGDRSAATGPVQVAGTFRDVAPGARTTCAIDTSNALSCWGDNSRAQIGDGTWNRRLTPMTISGASWSQAAVADTHTCGIGAQHKVFCWGTELDTGLGNGASIVASSIPLPIMALTADRVWARSEDTWTVEGKLPSRWGDNASGQLGTGNVSPQSSPLTVSSDSFEDLAVGHDHACVIRSANAGHVSCTGLNTDGELGTNSSNNSLGFTDIVDTTSSTYTKVYAGTHHSCALDTAGHAHCWGRGSFGELGNGVAGDSKTPVYTAPVSAFTQLALGDHHTCGLDPSGSVVCWGRNHRGQLGDGTTTDKLALTKVPNLTAVKIAAGYDYTCALTAASALICWGDNRDGQLGTKTGWSSSYFLVPSP